MTHEDATKLANAWVSYQVEADVRDFWAVEDLLEKTHRDPEGAWQAIQLIVRDERSLSPEVRAMVLSVLAAGPMEELVLHSGERIIDELELEVQNAPDLKLVLAGMYRHGIRDDIWRRIRALI